MHPTTGRPLPLLLFLVLAALAGCTEPAGDDAPLYKATTSESFMIPIEETVRFGPYIGLDTPTGFYGYGQQVLVHEVRPAEGEHFMGADITVSWQTNLLDQRLEAQLIYWHPYNASSELMAGDVVARDEGLSPLAIQEADMALPVGEDEYLMLLVRAGAAGGADLDVVQARVSPDTFDVQASGTVTTESGRFVQTR